MLTWIDGIMSSGGCELGIAGLSHGNLVLVHAVADVHVAVPRLADRPEVGDRHQIVGAWEHGAQRNRDGGVQWKAPPLLGSVILDAL